MEKIINVMFLLLFCATLFAQNTDTTAVAKADTIVPKKTTELPEVGITAKKPVYMTDGRCRTRRAWRSMWRAISPCAESHRYRYGLTIDLPI